MTRHAQILIVGGGVVRCAAVLAAARAGHDVPLLEQFAIGHDRGSSHGPSRVIRLAYDRADYVALAQASFAAWAALERVAGCELLQRMPGVDFGVPGTAAIDGIRATYQSTQVAVEEFDAELMRHYSQLSVDPRGTALSHDSYPASDARAPEAAAEARVP